MPDRNEHRVRVSDHRAGPCLPGKTPGGGEALCASPTRAAAPAMTRVLLVDDDDAFRKAFHIVLTRAGYEVFQAVNGIEAESAFDRYDPNVVITDLIMPEQEGISTIQALRQRKPGVKIIAVSGGGRVNAEDYLVLAKGFGAARTLAKPFHPDVLLAAVEEVLAVP
jgi:DNA-binding response OmpR family regulator